MRAPTLPLRSIPWGAKGPGFGFLQLTHFTSQWSKEHPHSPQRAQPCDRRACKADTSHVEPEFATRSCLICSCEAPVFVSNIPLCLARDELLSESPRPDRFCLNHRFSARKRGRLRVKLELGGFLCTGRRPPKETTGDVLLKQFSTFNRGCPFGHSPLWLTRAPQIE